MAEKDSSPVVTTTTVQRFFKRPVFAKVYAISSLVILCATTCYWAILGAQIHKGNADQMANTYLFEHVTTFTSAILPDQHTFLLKWPLFLLIRAFGSTDVAFATATVTVALATVAGLAYILFRIERRALIFGTLCLALAGVLLLIPAQPYPGGVLPMNMAMVTTRNLEYLVFIGGMLLAAKAGGLWSWRFFGAGTILGLLIASDKLFLTLSVGGALLGLAIYSLFRKWRMVKVMAIWLVAGILGGVLATLILWLMNTTGLTHIAKDGAITGPYGLVHSGKDVLLGTVYAMLGLATNFGANPVADTRLLALWPGKVLSAMASMYSVGFVANAIISVTGIGAVAYAAVKSIRPEQPAIPQKKFKKQPKKVPSTDSLAIDLSVMLILSTIVAVAAFVASKHYYPVDARYMGIALFTLFICLATAARRYRNVRPDVVAVIGAVLALGVVLGIGTATSMYTAEQQAMTETNKRNSSIAEALKHHPVDLLVGDYWRVLPIKLNKGNQQNIIPMANCTQNRDLLASKAWQKDLGHHSFAYILTFDKSLTGYEPCGLRQVAAVYGFPNASVLLAGDLKHPKELLLFYDKGSNKSSPAKINRPISTVTPVNIDDIPHVTCTGATIMNVVAHEDDDLLFMSPDLLHDVKAGHCVRTVYVTSGDAGTGKYYWLSRERGSQAAYAYMIGTPNAIWIQRTAKLPGGQFVTIANPQGNPRISLIFMHLPDGNVSGQGFKASNNESLARLERGAIPAIHSADMQSSYTAGTLADGLTAIMQGYQPQQVRTQASLVDRHVPDHSDHMATGHFAKQAYARYTQSAGHPENVAPLSYYIGYPIRNRPANLFGEDLEQKQQAFFEYARFDGGACTSVLQCQGTAYDGYLKRQYQNEY